MCFKLLINFTFLFFLLLVHICVGKSECESFILLKYFYLNVCFKLLINFTFVFLLLFVHICVGYMVWQPQPTPNYIVAIVLIWARTKRKDSLTTMTMMALSYFSSRCWEPSPNIVMHLHPHQRTQAHPHYHLHQHCVWKRGNLCGGSFCV